jgi:uncharacterized membrane protein (UPF0136 family)
MILGGILGYVLPKKPSKVSLISGGVSGLLAVGAFCASRYGQGAFGLGLGLVVSAGVAVMMYLRFEETKKFMPGGLIAAISGVVAVLVAVALALPS